MACSKGIQVQYYHDDELTSEHRLAMEAHLRECAECHQVLAELRSLSSMIVRAPLADRPTGEAIRLDQCRRAARDRGVLRLAGWMTATAAAVLVGALLIRGNERTDTALGPEVWQTVAVTPPEDIREGDNSDLAQWMLDDLSSESNGDLR
jgi:anti-sigma factor RsiW